MSFLFPVTASGEEASYARVFFFSLYSEFPDYSLDSSEYKFLYK